MSPWKEGGVMKSEKRKCKNVDERKMEMSREIKKEYIKR